MTLGSIAFWFVLACWFLLVAGFVIRKRPPRARETKRAKGWARGLALQSAAVAIVWLMHRRPSRPILMAAPPALDTVLAVFAMVLAAASVYFMIAAQRTLGRQFAYEPRLVEGHRLITEGPYRLVRHPIYTGLYGLTLAWALVRSPLIAIPLFTIVFAAGTALRVMKEERLLRSEFGPEFDAYRARVPAVIPRLFR